MICGKNQVALFLLLFRFFLGFAVILAVFPLLFQFFPTKSKALFNGILKIARTQNINHQLAFLSFPHS